VDGGPIKTI
jgi:hypothetical protein